MEVLSTQLHKNSFHTVIYHGFSAGAGVKWSPWEADFKPEICPEIQTRNSTVNGLILSSLTFKLPKPRINCVHLHEIPFPTLNCSPPEAYCF